MDDDTRPDLAIVIDARIGIDNRIIADRGVFTHVSARENVRALADVRTGLNDSHRIDASTRGNRGFFRHVSALGNKAPFLAFDKFEHHLKCPGKPRIRVLRHN